MSSDGFIFEGRDMTAGQVRELMPAYQRVPLGRFQSGLEAGIKTMHGMVTHIERMSWQGRNASYRAGGQRLRNKSIREGIA